MFFLRHSVVTLSVYSDSFFDSARCTRNSLTFLCSLTFIVAATRRDDDDDDDDDDDKVRKNVKS